MVIAPVMNVGLKGNYNTNFLGKRVTNPGSYESSENNSRQDNKKGGLNKSLPLAVLLAMSPVANTPVNAVDRLDSNNSRIELAENLESDVVNDVNEAQQQQSRIIKSQVYKLNNNGKLTAKYISTDNNSTNFEKVTATLHYDGKQDVTYNLAGFENYVYRIISDNDRILILNNNSQAIFKNNSGRGIRLGTDDSRYKDFVNDLGSNLRIKSNNTNIKVSGKPVSLVGFENNLFGADWVGLNFRVNKNVMSSRGFKLPNNAKLVGTFTEDDIKSCYRVNYYNTTGARSEVGLVDLVTVTGKSFTSSNTSSKYFPELKVKSITNRLIYLENKENKHKPATVRIYQVNLTDADGKSYIIFDRELFNALDVIYKSKYYNKKAFIKNPDRRDEISVDTKSGRAFNIERDEDGSKVLYTNDDLFLE